MTLLTVQEVKDIETPNIRGISLMKAQFPRLISNGSAYQFTRDNNRPHRLNVRIKGSKQRVLPFYFIYKDSEREVDLMLQLLERYTSRRVKLPFIFCSNFKKWTPEDNLIRHTAKMAWHYLKVADPFQYVCININFSNPEAIIYEIGQSDEKKIGVREQFRTNSLELRIGNYNGYFTALFADAGRKDLVSRSCRKINQESLF